MRPDRLLEPRKDAVLGLKMVRKMLLENELQDHDAPCCKGRVVVVESIHNGCRGFLKRSFTVGRAYLD